MNDTDASGKSPMNVSSMPSTEMLRNGIVPMSLDMLPEYAPGDPVIVKEPVMACPSTDVV
jgi:hypothetical protein